MLFTRRGLLLWHTPGYVRRNGRTTLADFFQEMWVAPLFAVAGIAWLALTHPVELFVSGPVLLLWLASPVVGWWISRPLAADQPVLSDAQRTFLRGLARQTWRYFEVLVNAEEHWLPPDNFQEVPTPVVASRTSPTNIGLALVANLAAGDFGYLSIGQLLDRTDKSLTTMEQLERYRGHLYNWYDTRTLKPLRPHYVSSVDSGNLAGALFTLRAGLWELKDQPIVSPRVLTGLRDTLERLSSPAIGRLREKLQAPPPPTVPAMLALLQELSRDVAALPANGDAEQQWWAQALVRQCHAARDDLQFLVSDPRQFDHMPTLQELAARVHRGRPRRRAHPANRPTRPALHRVGGDGLRLPVRSGPRFVVDRLQRHRPSLRSVVLRPARLGGAVGEFHPDRPGPVAAGPLVCPGPAVDHPRWCDGVAVVERLDVRVPDAAAGDADLRAHAARSDLSGGRGPPDRIRPAAWRAMGHFRVVLQHHRRPRHLSVWRVRRAGFGASSAVSPTIWSSRRTRRCWR